MAIVVTLRYDQNTRERDQLGDLTTAVYDVMVAANPNAYPQGGEPISFVAQFNAVHSVICDPMFEPPVEGAADAVGAMIAKFQRAAATQNTGFLRFYIGAVGNLAEHAVGVYATTFSFVITVHGRPATDAA